MFNFQVPRVAETRKPWYGVGYYLLVFGAFTYYMIELIAKHRYVDVVEATSFVIPTVMTQDFASSSPIFPVEWCDNASRNFFQGPSHCYNKSRCVFVATQDLAAIQATEIDLTMSYSGTEPSCESFYVLNSNMVFIFQFGYVDPTTSETVSVDQCEIVVTCTHTSMCDVINTEQSLYTPWTRDKTSGKFVTDVGSILASIGISPSQLMYNGAVVTAEFYFNTHRAWSMDIGPRCYFRMHLLNNLFAAGVQTSSVNYAVANATGDISFHQAFDQFFPMQLKLLMKSKAEVGVPSAFAVINHLLQMTVMTGVACTIVTTALTMTQAFREDVHVLDTVVVEKENTDEDEKKETEEVKVDAPLPDEAAQSAKKKKKKSSNEPIAHDVPPTQEVPPQKKKDEERDDEKTAATSNPFFINPQTAAPPPNKSLPHSESPTSNNNKFNKQAASSLQLTNLDNIFLGGEMEGGMDDVTTVSIMDYGTANEPDDAFEN